MHATRTEPTAYCSAYPDAVHVGCPSSIECHHWTLADAEAALADVADAATAAAEAEAAMHVYLDRALDANDLFAALRLELAQAERHAAEAQEAVNAAIAEAHDLPGFSWRRVNLARR